jgi:hypothetical protein
MNVKGWARRGVEWVVVVALVVGRVPVAGGAALAPVDSGPAVSAVLPAWWEVEGAAPAEAEAALMAGGTYTAHLPLVTRAYAPAGALMVTGWVEPWLALPGDVVTTTWVVSSTGALAMDQVALTVEVPAGLAMVEAGGGTADGTGALRWEVGELAPGAGATARWVGRVTAREMTVLSAEAQAWGRDVARHRVVTDTATTTVLVGRATTGTLTAAGGALRTPDGRTRLEAPPGAVAATTAVRVAEYPLPPREPGELDWVALFDVHAPALADGTGHTAFRHPLTVTMDLSGTVGGAEVYLLNFADGAGREQRPVTATFDAETGMLTAVQRCFSGDGAVRQSPFPDDGSYLPLSALPGVSAFSGAATYELALETPEGVGGLGPALALSYNSRSVDGILGVVQSSEVGLGWSLAGVAHIQRAIKTSGRKYTWQGRKRTYIQYEYRDQYTLELGGRSYPLLAAGPGPGGAGCRYETQERVPLRVVRYNHFCGYGAAGVPPGAGERHSGEYWEVTGAEGTHYRFGFAEDAEHLALMRPYRGAAFGRADELVWGWGYRFPGYAGALDDAVAYRWSVDRVTDRHGNAMTYHYHETKRQVAEFLPSYDRAVYLATVDYGGYQVEVVREGRGGHDAGPPRGLRADYARWQSERVRAIRVCVGPCAAGQVVREYVLSYDLPTLNWPGHEFTDPSRPPESTLLRRVRTYGSGGEAGGTALPPVELFYAPYVQADDEEDPTGGGHGGKLRYHRLTRLENGYGGWVGLDYEGVEESHRYSYRVTAREEGDGLGRRARTSYAYGPSCIARRTRPCWRAGEAQREVIVGHAVVTETAHGYGGEVLAAVRRAFHLEADEARGRAHRVVVRDGAGRVLEERRETWHVVLDDGGVAGRYNVELRERVVEREGEAQRTTYEYDGYGNVVARYEHGLAGLVGD